MEYFIAIALWCGSPTPVSYNTVNKCREEMIKCLQTDKKTNIDSVNDIINKCFSEFKLK